MESCSLRDFTQFYLALTVVTEKAKVVLGEESGPERPIKPPAYVPIAMVIWDIYWVGSWIGFEEGL